MDRKRPFFFVCLFKPFFWAWWREVGGRALRYRVVCVCVQTGERSEAEVEKKRKKEGEGRVGRGARRRGSSPSHTSFFFSEARAGGHTHSTQHRPPMHSLAPTLAGRSLAATRPGAGAGPPKAGRPALARPRATTGSGGGLETSVSLGPPTPGGAGGAGRVSPAPGTSSKAAALSLDDVDITSEVREEGGRGWAGGKEGRQNRRRRPIFLAVQPARPPPPPSRPRPTASPSHALKPPPLALPIAPGRH